MKNYLLMITLALTCIGCEPMTVSNSSTRRDSDAADVDRDNSRVNSRDQSGAAKTALDQNENERDIGITADIRKRVVDSKMSINAQNVKIITQNGKVTLRGPVKSDDEKKRIEDIARDVAGENNVDSQLEVESNP